MTDATGLPPHTGLRLILVRHGQTEANLRMALDSHPPGPPLTEEGHRQAKLLADSLVAEPVTAVYASTAIRAQQTAQPVADRHGLSMTILEDIQEVSMGDLEGRTDEAALRVCVEVFVAWAQGDLDRAVPGGESGREVIDRYQRVVAGLRDRHPSGVLVVVSHGAAIGVAALAMAGNTRLAPAESGVLPNTGRVVLEADHATRGGWRCVEWTGRTLT